MTEKIELGELELAALLCSRVCHDVISPVGAITNGLEVLEDDGDEQMRGFAMDLIKKSAAQASASLEFARLAYGAAGSAGAALELPELERVAVGFAQSDKISVEWSAPAGLVEKELGRLLLNLVVISIKAIPRGGKIVVSVSEPLNTPRFVLRCEGFGARVPLDVESLLSGDIPGDVIDARSIQPFFTGMLARKTGMMVAVAMDGGEVLVTASPST